LGWGSDLRFRVAFSEGYSHAMTLNNDARISKGFVAALRDPRLPADCGIVGPMIDHGFPCAEAAGQKPDAANYIPRPKYRVVPAVEGTALTLARECWQMIGGLDLRTFGGYGWGIDLDLALCAHKAGYDSYTRRRPISTILDANCEDALWQLAV
jgi:GT2 family glycosyltransferase